MNRLLAILSCAALPGCLLAQIPDEIWVATEASAEICVIDGSTDTFDTCFDISDPDGDSVVDTPRDLAFSNLLGTTGPWAFVAQDGIINVIDVQARTQVNFEDVEARVAGSGACGTVTGLTLRGLASATPRQFFDPAMGGAVTLSRLYAVADLSDGSVALLVLDQGILVTSPAMSPLVECVIVKAAGTGSDVAVVDTPSGADFQRVWVTGSSPDPGGEILWSVQVGVAQTTGVSSGVRRTVEHSPDPIQPVPFRIEAANAFGREFAVMPRGLSGLLDNLATDGECDLLGEVTNVSITGPGPDAYAVHALKPTDQKMVVVDPVDCTQVEFDTQSLPVDIGVEGQCAWQKMFSANKDSDSVTIVKKLVGGGFQTDQVSLLPPMSPLMVKAPIAIGQVPLQATCTISQVVVEKFDEDGDMINDDLHITWDAANCAPGTPFKVLCKCEDDDPQCPCFCEFAGPDCFIYDDGQPFSAGGPMPPPLMDLWWGGGVTPKKNPWKVLGVTQDEMHDELGAAEGDHDLGIIVVEDEP